MKYKNFDDPWYRAQRKILKGAVQDAQASPCAVQNDSPSLQRHRRAVSDEIRNFR